MPAFHPMFTCIRCPGKTFSVFEGISHIQLTHLNNVGDIKPEHVMEYECPAAGCRAKFLLWNRANAHQIEKGEGHTPRRINIRRYTDDQKLLAFQLFEDTFHELMTCSGQAFYVPNITDAIREEHTNPRHPPEARRAVRGQPATRRSRTPNSRATSRMTRTPISRANSRATGTPMSRGSTPVEERRTPAGRGRACGSVARSRSGTPTTPAYRRTPNSQRRGTPSTGRYQTRAVSRAMEEQEVAIRRQAEEENRKAVLAALEATNELTKKAERKAARRPGGAPEGAPAAKRDRRAVSQNLLPSSDDEEEIRPNPPRIKPKAEPVTDPTAPGPSGIRWSPPRMPRIPTRERASLDTLATAEPAKPPVTSPTAPGPSGTRRPPTRVQKTPTRSRRTPAKERTPARERTPAYDPAMAAPERRPPLYGRRRETTPAKERTPPPKTTVTAQRPGQPQEPARQEAGPVHFNGAAQDNDNAGLQSSARRIAHQPRPSTNGDSDKPERVLHRHQAPAAGRGEPPRSRLPPMRPMAQRPQEPSRSNGAEVVSAPSSRPVISTGQQQPAPPATLKKLFNPLPSPADLRPQEHQPVRQSDQPFRLAPATQPPAPPSGGIRTAQAQQTTPAMPNHQQAAEKKLFLSTPQAAPSAATRRFSMVRQFPSGPPAPAAPGPVDRRLANQPAPPPAAQPAPPPPAEEPVTPFSLLQRAVREQAARPLMVPPPPAQFRPPPFQRPGAAPPVPPHRPR